MTLTRHFVFQLLSTLKIYWVPIFMITLTSRTGRKSSRIFVIEMAWITAIFFPTLVAAASGNLSPIQVLKTHLETTNYDKGIRPNYGENATLIMVDAYVESFGKIEEVDMEITTFLYFRQEWKDPRLANVLNSTVALTKQDIGLVWRPDTYCFNSRETDMDMEDKALHSVLRLKPSGDVYYSRNTRLVVACEMELHDFPMDIQHCNITFGSYGFPIDEVDYKWKSNEVPVRHLSMSQFSVTSSNTSREPYYLSTGIFSSITVTFSLQRHVGYYVIQLYLPCIFLVMLSWIVFWTNPENYGDRLTVGITCILTIVFLLGYVNAMLPKVSYAKGVDWYLMTSFLFIFLSLLECIVVERLLTSKAQESRDEGHDNKACDTSPEFSLNNIDITIRRSSETVQITSSDFDMQEDVKRKGMVQVLPLTKKNMTGNEKSEVDPRSPDKKISTEKPGEKTTSKLTSGCGRSWAIKLDLASRILFPLAYALYNTLYWYMYLNGIDAQA
ncbi:gamma-aminobutyric acid receptor subunit alpha-6-like [Montipora capricornis]|uniref:gamma-aminobutyric acid receptor subunit alpha-6-like n=1 Tax=Montipora capricornis TaxID=246305 RepID=UPI0035F1C077